MKNSKNLFLYSVDTDMYVSHASAPEGSPIISLY